MQLASNHKCKAEECRVCANGNINTDKSADVTSICDMCKVQVKVAVEVMKLEMREETYSYEYGHQY